MLYKGGKFLKKLWCCIGGEYYKIIWLNQGVECTLVHKPLSSLETLISRNASKEILGNFPGILESWMKQVDSSID